MRKNFGAKPILYPQPVLIIATYDENGKPDSMNAAWGGLYDADKVDKLLDNPKLLKTPIVRNGRQATVGYCPEVWESWS